ncbi:MAG: hypothetical protein R3E96_10245 [Planctomycetota bacterium]
MDAETMPEIFQGQHGPDQGGCYLYGRHFNPTVYARAPNGGAGGAEAGYCGDGISAISATILQLCGSGIARGFEATRSTAAPSRC